MTTNPPRCDRGASAARRAAWRSWPRHSTSLGEVGYAGLTIEGIAARSGTGKQTIYRWWPSKADVLLDALATKADLHVPVSDDGSYTADLRAFLTETFTLARNPHMADVLRALMAEAQINPDSANGFAPRSSSAAGTLSESFSTVPGPAATSRPDCHPPSSPTSCSAPSGTGCWPPGSPSTSSSSTTSWPCSPGRDPIPSLLRPGRAPDPPRTILGTGTGAFDDHGRACGRAADGDTRTRPISTELAPSSA